MTVTSEKVVSIHYTLKNGEGRVIDSSAEGEPLVYLHGSSNIIPGLENALEGKTKGEKLKVTVPPEQAYGLRSENLIQNVPKSQFQDPESLQPGMQFQVRTPQGGMILTILEVKDSEVVVDGNPPLAGETLFFDVEITDIREATRQEVEHGHAHGPGQDHQQD